MKWEFPLFIVDSTLNPFKLKKVGRPREHDAKELLELINETMSATQIVKAANEERDIPRRRTYELLAELKAAGLIKQPKPRGHYEPI